MIGRVGAWIVSASLAVGVMTVPSAAHADPTDPAAKDHYRRGGESFASADYEEASRQFEAGYAIEPDPLFLFAWAQSENQRGDCKSAVRLYTQFIAKDVPESAKKSAREAIVACAERLAQSPDPPDDPIDEPDEDPIDDPIGDPVQPEIDDQPRPTARKWYLDPVGDSLVGIGVVGVGVGAGLLIGSAVLGGKPQPPSYAEFLDRIDKVDRLQLAGAITLSVGGALLIGGVVRWALVARRAKRTQVAATFGSGVTGLTVHGRF